MQKDQNLIIDEFAVQIRNLLKINKDNFNIEQLVASLGGEISEGKPSMSEASIIKISNEKLNHSFLIKLDSFTSNEQRRRFTIAHELGHLFLHMKYLINDDYWSKIKIGEGFSRNKEGSYPLYEQQANYFAAAFLMPVDRFYKIAEDTSDIEFYDVNEIAKRFNVSITAVKIRGKDLQLWEEYI